MEIQDSDTWTSFMKVTVTLPSYFANVSSTDSASCRGSKCGSFNKKLLDVLDVHDNLELKDEVREDFELVDYVFCDLTEDETSEGWCTNASIYRAVKMIKRSVLRIL